VNGRAFVVVLDACGVGALPDAADYGDQGSNTLAHLAHAAGGLELPTLGGLGLGSILPLEGVPAATAPVVHGRLNALGPGKDSMAGHHELMGIVAPRPAPTYADGFPPDVVRAVEQISGRGVICNRPYNGVGAIDDFGGEQIDTGALIVYTSEDSVLQVAAHVDVVPPPELYEICRRVRETMVGEHAVGRVIARPFTGRTGHFARTDGRHDYSLEPAGHSYLEELQASAVPVHSVGKVGELFAGVGIDVQHTGPTNAIAMSKTSELLDSLATGLVFTNLVETDQVYGHRHDVAGFHQALREIDERVAAWLAELREGDMLVLTADHGCDPASTRTDHTREYAPLLASFAGHGSRRHDGPLADVGASVLKWLTGRTAPELPGESFVR
jgi:phosphopentomutase